MCDTMIPKTYTRPLKGFTLRPTLGSFQSIDDLGVSICLNSGACGTINLFPGGKKPKLKK